MDREAAWIDRLRAMAGPGSRALRDDAAVLTLGAGALIATHDVLVEGVHWLADADPADVAWKLIATNLSDLAAKGARPSGVLLGFPLGRDDAWNARFADGLQTVLEAFEVPLLGGDTVRSPSVSARAIGVTALGTATSDPVPDRRSALAGQAVWVAGAIGDAGAGLAQLTGGGPINPALARAHRRPRPLLAEGRALARVTRAMLDVSDGLLLDAARLGAASGLSVAIDLDAIPLSPNFVAVRGDDREARLFAATAGDDYALLFTLAPGVSPPVEATRIGRLGAGSGLTLSDAHGPVPLPSVLGWSHG